MEFCSSKAWKFALGRTRFHGFFAFVGAICQKWPASAQIVMDEWIMMAVLRGQKVCYNAVINRPL
jgi:hypothetical protein